MREFKKGERVRAYTAYGRVEGIFTVSHQTDRTVFFSEHPNVGWYWRLCVPLKPKKPLRELWVCFYDNKTWTFIYKDWAHKFSLEKGIEFICFREVRASKRGKK